MTTQFRSNQTSSTGGLKYISTLHGRRGVEVSCYCLSYLNSIDPYYKLQRDFTNYFNAGNFSHLDFNSCQFWTGYHHQMSFFFFKLLILSQRQIIISNQSKTILKEHLIFFVRCIYDNLKSYQTNLTKKFVLPNDG